MEATQHSINPLPLNAAGVTVDHAGGITLDEIGRAHV